MLSILKTFQVKKMGKMVASDAFRSSIWVSILLKIKANYSTAQAQFQLSESLS